MTKIPASAIAILCLVSVALTACGGQPGSSDQSALNVAGATQAQPTATPVPALCDNPLGPVRPGVAWTYAATTNTDGATMFTTTITEVRPDGFTAMADLGENITIKQAWICTHDGLTLQSLSTGPSGLSLDIEGIQLDLTTSNPTGLILPARMEPGSPWSYGLDVSGKVKQGDAAANVEGTISTVFQDIDSESVTVPAGSFSATKVEATSTIKLTADYLILKIPVTSVIKTTLWLAPGVGLVKSMEAGDFMGTALSSTTELQAYQIP